jgi:hypothetical protein
MLVKLRNPDGGAIILNTDHLIAVIPAMEAPSNGKVQSITPVVATRIMGRSIVITRSSQHLVMGDPEDIYEKIKKRDLEGLVQES